MSTAHTYASANAAASRRLLGLLRAATLRGARKARMSYAAQMRTFILTIFRVVSLASNAAPLGVVEAVPEEQSAGTWRVHSLVLSDRRITDLRVSGSPS
jgi:hypothetical protein